MPIPAVKFAAHIPRPTLHATELEIKSPADLASLKTKVLPAAYVVNSADLVHLRLLKTEVIDRGSKPPATQLSHLLLGRDKPVLIAGNYSSATQLKRSINALLANAAKQADRNLYFIGVPLRLFLQLQQQALCRRPLIPVAVDLRMRSLFEQLRDEPVLKDIDKVFIGVSEQAQLVRHLITCAAKTDVPVFIHGESGTGKEVIARLIHKHSRREHQSFVPVNCAAIPTELFESELFGHKKGAFTGAVSNKRGLWEFASEGVLFLDEIGDLNPTHQAKILRALEGQEFRPVGGDREIQSKARVIAATNRNLTDLMRLGKFREDLFYRLFVWQIPTKPLRDHPEDIPPLALYFWRRVITKEESAVLPDDLLAELQNHTWPGNARELRTVLLRLHTLALTKRSLPTVALLRSVFYPLPM